MGAGPRVVGVGNFDRYPPEALTRTEGRRPHRSRCRAHHRAETRPRGRVRNAGRSPHAARARKDSDVPVPARRPAGHHHDDSRSSARASAAQRRARRLPTASKRRLQTSENGSPDGRGRARCSCSGATPKRFEASTRAAPSDSFTTCSRLRAGRTYLPTSSARASRRRASSRLRARPRSSSRLASTPRAPAAAISARGNRLASIPAVRNKRIYQLRGDGMMNPGPRISASVRRMAEVLHPDAFVEVKIESRK